MKRVLYALCLLIFIVSSMGACGSVTESGNPPLPGGEDSYYGEPSSESSSYTNITCGYTVTYSSAWTYEELSSTAVVFTDNGTETTTATFSCYTVSPEPSSFIDYLEEQYPSKNFTEYNTTTLTGYEYDDPTAGTSGGDVREYYFLNGDIMLIIDSEVFTDAETDFEDLLDGIAFE